MMSGQGVLDIRVVQIDGNPSESGSSREFPEDDGVNTPRVSSEQPSLASLQIARKRIYQNVGVQG